MTDDQLRKAETNYRRARDKADELRGKRDALVREALAEGWTHAKIAAATGLTRGRINQLKEES